MPINSYAQFHVETSAAAARKAHARQMRGEYELYVYFLPGGGRIEAHPESPGPEWELAWPERLPANLTVDQMVRYFAERTGRLPYLPND